MDSLGKGVALALPNAVRFTNVYVALIDRQLWTVQAKE